MPMPLMKLGEFSKKSGLSKQRIRELLKSGEPIGAIRLTPRGDWYFDYSEFQSFLMMKTESQIKMRAKMGAATDAPS